MKHRHLVIKFLLVFSLINTISILSTKAAKLLGIACDNKSFNNISNPIAYHNQDETTNNIFVNKNELLSTDITSDSTPENSVTAKKGSFILGANFLSNSSFYGRNAGDEKFPFMSYDATYSSKYGIWASVALYQMFNTSQTIDGTDLSAGWNFDITERLDGSISYSRFMFSDESAFLQSAASNLASASIGLDWSYVYSMLTFSSIFGTTDDVFLNFANSRYFEKEGIFTKDKDYLAIEPKISIIAGTQNFAMVYTEQQNALPLSKKPGKGKPGSQPAPTQGATENKGKFSIINYEVRVPVTYTYGNASLESTFIYTRPVNLLEGDFSKPQFIFGLSFYYVFQGK